MKKLFLVCLCISLLGPDASSTLPAETIVNDRFAETDSSTWRFLPPAACKVSGGELVMTADDKDPKGYNVIVAALKTSRDGLNFARNDVTIKLADLALKGTAIPANQVFILSLASGPVGAGGVSTFRVRLAADGSMGVSLNHQDGPPTKVWETSVKLPLKAFTIHLDPTGAKLSVEDADGPKEQETKWPAPLVEWEATTPSLTFQVQRNPGPGDASLTLKGLTAESVPNTTSNAVPPRQAFAASTRKGPGPIPVPTPSLTMKVRPAVLRQHPRLFFDAAGLAALKKKVADPRMAEIMRGFLAQADDAVAHDPTPNSPDDDHIRPLGDGTMPALALAYLITEDSKYFDSLRRWTTAFRSYPSWGGDDDLGGAHPLFGMAIAYDWLYDKWTPDERAAFERSITLHARLLMQRGAVPPVSNWFWGSAYFQNHNWINFTAVAAGALSVYETAPPEMQSYLDHVRTNMDFAYRHLGVDGANHEGPAYAFYGTNWLMYYFDLLKASTGENLYNMPYMKGIGRYLVYNVLPNAKDMVNFGDCPSQGWGALDAAVLYKLAAEYHDGHVEWLRKKNENVFAPAAGHSARRQGYFGSAFCVMWCDPGLVAQPPDDLPLTGVFNDLGLVVSRSSWADDASLVSLICGPPGGLHLMQVHPSLPHPYAAFSHSHPDANSFLFWTGGRWTVGNPAGYTHDKQTHNENVWLAGSHGQRGEAEWFDAASYLGNVPQPHLVRVADTPQADYIVGEAAPAYAPDADLTGFKRHLLFVKDAHPYVVVYDELTASKPQTFTAYLHAYDEFKTAGASAFTIGQTPYAYGSVFGPASYALQPTPLQVLSHPSRTIKQEGFQLAAKAPATAASTWLITVVDGENRPAKPGAGPLPSVTVGGDTVVFQRDDAVLLNGNPLTGNLIATAPK